MRYVLIFLVVLVFYSFNTINDNNELNNFQKQSLKVDSIYISYERMAYANGVYLTYKNKLLYVKSGYNDTIYKVIKNKSLISKFLNYVRIFYIDKSESIILKKERRLLIIETEYSIIMAKIYSSNKQISTKKTYIGEPAYNIEYNQKFLDFCNFIEKDIVHGYGLTKFKEFYKRAQDDVFIYDNKEFSIEKE